MFFMILLAAELAFLGICWRMLEDGEPKRENNLWQLR